LLPKTPKPQNNWIVIFELLMESNKNFDNSSKLLFAIGSTTTLGDESSHKSIHPQVEKEVAEQTMMSAVERMNKWN